MFLCSHQEIRHNTEIIETQRMISVQMNNLIDFFGNAQYKIIHTVNKADIVGSDVN